MVSLVVYSILTSTAVPVCRWGPGLLKAFQLSGINPKEALAYEDAAYE